MQSLLRVLGRMGAGPRVVSVGFALSLGFAMSQGCLADDSRDEAAPLEEYGGHEPRPVSSGAGGGEPVNGMLPCATEGAVRACGHSTHQQGDVIECAVGSQTCEGGVWGACAIDIFAPSTTVSLLAMSAACSANPCDPQCREFVETPYGLDAGTNTGLTIDGGILLTPGPCKGAGCPAVVCGDGIVSLGEQCDDGNKVSGDGCSSTCKLEPNFRCPTPGAKCVATPCGDGKVTGIETCDDGNSVSGDGCSATCQIEPGWKCPTPGAKCIAKGCGDGILAGDEQCDDGNNVSGDGCSATCTREVGFACTKQATAPNSVCHKTKCGDGIVEGFEQCDDGNLRPYDGCSPTCTIEPKCAGGACTAVCGDGLKFASEGCDDGNTTPGDGCSATCTVEPGFACTTIDQAPAAQLVIPILYRDFRYYNTTSGSPDFQNYNAGIQTGLVKPTLGADNEPVFLSAQGSLTDKTSFCWWYHDKSTALSPDCGPVGTVNPYTKGTGGTLGGAVFLDLAGNPTTLTLAQQGVGSNVYKFSNTNFFPVDGLGWNVSSPQTSAAGDGLQHNFSFTSELHYPFTYLASAPAAVFSFDGDDDVWAFINGHLVVDLGGVHSTSAKTYTLTAANATTLGLVDKGMYSIDLFQAERHTTGSDYTLTLNGFVHSVSQCSPICGDGLVKGKEVCDDGVNNGAYGGCMPGCAARAGYCGDGIVQNPQEECDDGTNATTYGGLVKNACAPGCKFAPYCGDGVVSNGEQCDDGPLNGTGPCNSDCTRAYYYEDSFSRDYDVSTCPAGTHARWTDAGLEAKFPTNAGAYGTISVTAQVGNSTAALSAPVKIATMTGPPVDQSAVWTNYDLYAPLLAADASYPGKTTLRLTFTLTPSADHSVTPDLLDWRARFDCAYSE